jgi:RHH-type proline utilization regulon transcriptional repressor/proline dehydrogenase/delta 1-pyrroline-5-carboxylate dehydrogenase
MRARGRRVHQLAGHSEHPLQHGTFVLPTLVEIDSLSELGREVFGPVLHFVRYQREELDGLVARINGTGYGLTMGLHTRIDETIARVVDAAHAGNIYVNRNMVGAVVGVQPFGGEGLSGTGPKAGGPLYLYRLLARRPDDVLARALETQADAAAPPPASTGPLGALLAWIAAQHPALHAACVRMAAQARPGASVVLPGPTGERNVYTIAPRSSVLCLASNEADRLVQLAAVLAVGSRAIWSADAQALLQRLPPEVQAQVALARDWAAPEVAYESVLLHGSPQELAQVQQHLARRDGPVVSAERMEPGETSVPLERLVIERALSINTAAAGGNASLMTIG